MYLVQEERGHIVLNVAFNFELDVRRLGGAEVVVEGVEHVEVQAAAGGRGVVELCSGR